MGREECTHQSVAPPGGTRADDVVGFPQLMSRLQSYFEDYASHHATRGNLICHEIAVPVITIAVFGLLARVPLGALEPIGIFRLDAAVLLLAAAVLWYLLLDWKLALPFGMFAFGLYLLGRSIAPSVLWTAFVAGWVLQFVGHYRFEKRSPAFYRNVLHLLIGPLWLFARITGYGGEASARP